MKLRNLAIGFAAIMLANVSFVAINAQSKANKKSKKTTTAVQRVEKEPAKVERRNVTPFEGTVSIAMTGDIMTGTILPERNMPPNDGRDIFVDCAELLKGADVACGNLEGVLSDKGKTRKAPGPLSFSFMMPTKSVNLLVDAGYDFMGIANNHINDFYPECIATTIKTLRENVIGVAGTKDCEYSLCDINGVRYGFCAFGHESYTLRTQDTPTVKRVLRELRPQCDILIVCFHGGSEGISERHLPYGTEYFHGADRGNLREFAHLCIDNGADIVYGHGPHVPRAMELYKDHFIAYSLGNFATPRGMKLVNQTSYAPLLMVRLNAKGEFVDGKIHPFIQYRDKGPRVDKTGAVVKEIRTLTEEDFKDNKLNIADDGTITRK